MTERLEDWKEACREVDLAGIYDEFQDAADAIRQMGHYIHEAEEALPGLPEGVTGSLAGRITALRNTEAEPVAWQQTFIGGSWYNVLKYEMEHYRDHPDYEHRALYTNPPGTKEEALKKGGEV